MHISLCDYLYDMTQLFMLAVSFYKPVEYFSGSFNRLVTWMTSGEFCHCELVVQTKPEDIMKTIKTVHTSARDQKYSEEDCKRIIQAIEINFFDDVHFRKAVQSSDVITLSFSLLWGNPMSVRVLQPENESNDSWFKIPPMMKGGPVELVKMSEDPEHISKTLEFAIEELGKDYDTSGALCSWLPWGSQNQNPTCDSYFCSEFVVLSFQRLGYMKDMSASHTTPNALYAHVTDTS